MNFSWKEHFIDPWGRASAYSKRKVTLKFPWIHGCSSSSWICEELRKPGLVMSTKAKHGRENTEKVTVVCASLDLKTEDSASNALLRACAKKKDLCGGIRVHADLLKRGLLEKNSCALISMYAKCGLPVKAQELLHELSVQDIFTWTAVIAAYAQQGQGQNALNSFEQMQHEGLSPDAVTFTCILKACGGIGALDKGEQIHDQIVEQGLLGSNVLLGTALVDMYAKCGALAKAHRVLKELSIRDVISWNTLLGGYIQHGQVQDALYCFEQMQREGVSPNAVTFMSILKVYGSIGAAEKGEQVHEEIARQGLLEDVVLSKALVDMYAKCGALAKAQRVLEELPVHDVILWSALIAKYVQQGQGEKALNCFDCSRSKGLFPDGVTFIFVLKACGSMGAVDKGKQIHDEIIKQGLLEKNILIGTALVDMYAKCGALGKAQEVLDELPIRDVVIWSALIAGYAQAGQGQEALNCFDRMQREGFSPNAVTFICSLKACGIIGAIDKGEQIHNVIAKQGLLRQNVVLGNALVDMYAKCGALAKAARVLEELPVRDVVSWNALIAGYAQQGQGQDALNCFKRLQHEGLFPDAVTFTCILKACGSIGAVDKGGQIHAEIARQGLLGTDIVLGTALLDMYVKCGAPAKAQQVLKHLPVRDVVSWSALIAGFAELGHGKEALNCFKQMQCQGLSPDALTFSCVLNACSHSGLTDEGQTFFANMSTRFGMKPDLQHLIFMVDLFGHAGHLDRAVAVIQNMPSSICSAVWSAMLGVCQEWGDVKVGRWAFEHALQVDKGDATPYVCMTNIYTAAGMQENAESFESDKDRMQKRRLSSIV